MFSCINMRHDSTTSGYLYIIIAQTTFEGGLSSKCLHSYSSVAVFFRAVCTWTWMYTLHTKQHWRTTKSTDVLSVGTFVSQIKQAVFVREMLSWVEEACSHASFELTELSFILVIRSPLIHVNARSEQRLIFYIICFSQLIIDRNITSHVCGLCTHTT